MRCGNRIWSFFAGTVLEVDRILFAAALSVTEDEPVRANTFFFNEVVNYCIYPIPAELLSGLAGFAISDNSDLTVGIVTQFLSSAGQQGFVVLGQGYRASLEVDAGEVADIALVAIS